MEPTNENTVTNYSRIFKSMNMYNQNSQLMESAIRKQRAEKSTISAIGADNSSKLINENQSRMQDKMFAFE